MPSDCAVKKIISELVRFKLLAPEAHNTVLSIRLILGQSHRRRSGKNSPVPQDQIADPVIGSVDLGTEIFSSSFSITFANRSSTVLGT